MKAISLLSVGLACVLSSTSAVSESHHCDLLVTVGEESTVETWNISKTMQVGSVFLKLFDEHGETVYEADGMVIGRISRVDNSGPYPVTYVNHRIYFDDGSRLFTRDDMALPDFYPEIEIPEGSIPVLETITQVKGTGAFQYGYTDGITARGFMTPVPGGENYFELSGTICMD
jgi:hypothetical protein